jgi:hypothetical protein
MHRHTMRVTTGTRASSDPNARESCEDVKNSQGPEDHSEQSRPFTIA